MYPQGPAGGPPPGMPPPGHAAAPGAYAPPAPAKATKGCGKVAIIAGVLGVTLLVVGVAVGIYFFGASGTKVQSVAHTHLPEGCDVALRMDMKALMKVEPVKEHVVSAIEEVMKEEGGGRLAAFLIAARMDPKKDIHEVAVCLEDVKLGSDPDYGIVVGGKFLDEDGVVKAIDKHDAADEFKSPKKVGKLLVVEDEEGVLISQSPDDAALLFSGDKKNLKDLAETGKSFEDYDIPMDEQIVAVISPETMSGFLGILGPLGPATGELKKVGRVVLTMTLDPGELGIRMTFPDKGTAKKAKGELETFVAAMALAPFGPTADPDVKKALGKAKVKTKGGDVLFTMPIPEDSIEETCEELGDEIREQNEKK